MSTTLERVLVERALDGKPYRAPTVLMDLHALIQLAIQAYMDNQPVPDRVQKDLIRLVADADAMLNRKPTRPALRLIQGGKK